MEQEETHLLGMSESARQLGMCNQTLKRHADEGLIPVVRDSVRRRLFLVADVQRYKAQREAKKAARR